MKFSFLVLSLWLMSGCVSLNSVSLTSVPQDRRQKVRAVGDRFIFLGFNFDNDYVNAITLDLKNQCPNGTVSGVLTKSESINYFLYIFHTNRVTATGYCVPSKVASGGPLVKKRKPTDEGGGAESSGDEADSAEASPNEGKMQ